MTDRPPNSSPESNQVSGAIRLVFVVLALFLVCSLTYLLLLGRAVLVAAASVNTEHSTIDRLREVLSVLKDAETGQRGYLLTGDEAYLKPHADAVRLIGADLEKLEALAKAGRLPRSGVEKFREITRSKLAELDRTIALRKEKGFDAALAAVRDNSGLAFMDELRALTDRMIDLRTGNLTDERSREHHLTRVRDVSFALVVLVNLGALAWAYRKIARESILRLAAVEEAHGAKALLGVALASIGDGVILTDASGTITFLNPVSEQLTGWSSAEAIGRKCSEVFDIVNETTRQTVESPVDKVLRLGTVVGLANHTLLIRHDGTEIPIDDSGAPIRTESGETRGVVLVFRDFSRHKEVEAALRIAMEDAQAANIAKDNFIATLSHELRTPLTPVVITLATWSAGGSVPGSWREDVEMMRRNLDLEARLIDDLLDLTRIVRGKLSLNRVVADLHDLLAAVTGMSQSQFLSRHLRLTLDLRASTHHVFADPARLQQVFLNVLRNAAKFTAEGGAVEVQTYNDENGQVRVDIRDNGIGMSETVIAKLFQPFEQGTAEVVKRYGGLGLGMAISKALVEAQGGTISAESKGLGQGSTFRIQLPAVESPAEASLVAVESQTSTPALRLRILVAEDHRDTARALSRLLERWGYEVQCAETVAAAVRMARVGRFNLLLSDIGLPDGTGNDLIRQIRQFSDMPAIALSGFGMEEDVAECREAGFNDHLTKPVNFQRLATTIQRVSFPGDAAARQSLSAAVSQDRDPGTRSVTEEAGS